MRIQFGARRWNAGAQRSLTLVELLVAIALSVILIGVMTFVWLRSSEIFAVQLNRIETYQRVRNILDTIERDISNTQLSGDMEFYTDVNGNGFFDAGDTQFPNAFNPANDLRDPGDPADPLLTAGGPEFGALPGAHPFNTGAFIRAPTILSPEPYKITSADGYLENRAYWRDEVYVRSFITVGDRNRPALIHYRLVQPLPDGRSVLRRRVWFVNAQGQITPEEDQVDIRAVDVCDLKISFMFKRSPIGGNAILYHGAPQAPNGFGDPEMDDLLQRDLARGYSSTYSPPVDPDGAGPLPPTSEPLSTQHVTRPDANLITQFFYEGCARLEEPEVGEVALRTLTGAVTDDLTGTQFAMAGTNDIDQYSNFGFDGVRPGSRVLVFDATDDDPNFIGGNQAAGALFPARLYTVDSVSAESATSIGGNSILSLRFLEKVPFGTLKRTWLGPEVEVDVQDSHVTANPDGGPTRIIKASFNVHYRVGFLPSAFLVRMSVDDRYNQKILPMERVIRLLQQ